MTSWPTEGTWQPFDEACHATVTWLSFLSFFPEFSSSAWIRMPLPSRERTCGLSCRWWPSQPAQGIQLPQFYNTVGDSRR